METDDPQIHRNRERQRTSVCEIGKSIGAVCETTTNPEWGREAEEQNIIGRRVRAGRVLSLGRDRIQFIF